jgi:Tetracyclin repressor-like, C-terminal domain
VSYQIKGWGRGVDAATAMKEGRIAAATFPAIAHTASLRKWDFDKSFEFGLSIILVGLAASART